MLSRKDLTIIIRSSGERTVPAIWELLKQQLNEKQIFEVEEVPNSRALRKAFEIAKNDNRKWLLLIDGDVLPFKKMLKRMLSIGEKIDNRVFCIQCDLIDKMVRNFRPAGVHMYRTSLLNKARELIPAENTMMRPESTTMSRMEKRGYPTLFVEEVMGLHDYEQYYRDLFRKGFFSAHKHTNKIDYFQKLWIRLENIDEDYKVLLDGLTRGEQHDGLVVSNVKYFERFDMHHILSETGVAEKKALFTGEVDFGLISNISDEFEIPTEYYDHQLFLEEKPQKRIPFNRKFLQLKGKIGFWKLSPWLIGNYLEKGGRRLKKMLED